MLPRSSQSFPTKKYSVIYADPPWTFQTHSEKGKGRSAEMHYPCMSLADIKKLPVADLAAENCVLLMWVTDPMLPAGLEVLKAWGFTYKTVGFTWGKLNADGSAFMGGGYWTRANPELCLLATRGHPKRVEKNVRRLVLERRREHSRKPDRIYRDIERLCGDVPRIELFSRTKAPGWDAWGYDTDTFKPEETAIRERQ